MSYKLTPELTETLKRQAAEIRRRLRDEVVKDSFGRGQFYRLTCDFGLPLKIANWMLGINVLMSVPAVVWVLAVREKGLKPHRDHVLEWLLRWKDAAAIKERLGQYAPLPVEVQRDGRLNVIRKFLSISQLAFRFFDSVSQGQLFGVGPASAPSER